MTREEDEDHKSGDKGMKKIIIIFAAIFILLLGVIVGLLFFLLNSEGFDKGSGEQLSAEQMQEEVEEIVPAGESFFYTIRPPFTVNFIASRHAKFLRVSVDLVVREQEGIDFIEKNLPFIKNDLVTIFSSKSFDELKTSEGKELLRDEALEKVKEVLVRETGKPWVTNILFTSFVMD